MAQGSDEQPSYGPDPGAPYGQTPAQPPVTPPQGERTHPASALVRVWIWIAAGLVGFGRNALEQHDRSVFTLIWVVVAIAAVAAVVGAAFGYLSWWFTRYTIDGRELRVDSGVLTRRSRRAPYERIQSVDIAEPLAARIFGLCELRIELAGGDDSRVPLQYLRRSDAERLRGLLLHRAYEAGSAAVREEADAVGGAAAAAGAAGHDTAGGAGAPYAPGGVPAAEGAADGAAAPTGVDGRAGVPVPPAAGTLDQVPPILVVPPQRLVVATLLSTEFLMPLGLTSALLVMGLFVPGVYFGVIPFLLWLVQIVSNRVVAQWGFTLRRTPRGLHITRGLLSRVSQTVPFERVQAVVAHEALLWRWFGWQRAEVTVAGASRDSDDGGSTLLPIGRPDDIRRVTSELFPDVDVAAVERVRAPSRSWPFAPIGWRLRAAGVGERAFVSESGWLSHRTDVVPHAKTQSVALTQGPLQRLLRTADLAVHTPSGPVTAAGYQLDAGAARDLMQAQLVHARTAREALGER